MHRALELAQLGRGRVSPNPMVGCVIVHEDKIIGEGWHQKYGAAHAEVNAVKAVRDQSLLSESTVYVTLEPCAHHGRTPPCADLLVRHQVKRVVIGVVDTNPLVGGKGIEKLQNEGIEVFSGVLEKECREMNVRFFTSIEKARPYIILKWAQTADGFVARKNFDSKWISNEHSRNTVHQWRAEEDAILVGTNTAQFDDPRLNVRGVEGENPVRIVIDKALKLDLGLKLFDRSQPTIVYNLKQDHQEENLTFVKLEKTAFLKQLLEDLYKRKIQSVIVEGGAGTLNSFIGAGLWDEARIFTAKTEFGEGILAPTLAGHEIQKLDVKGDDLIVLRNEL